MKTLSFTNKEFNVLQDVILHHPCESVCINKTNSDCFDRDSNGNIKCPIQKAYESLVKKIIINNYEETKIKA